MVVGCDRGMINFAVVVGCWFDVVEGGDKEPVDSCLAVGVGGGQSLFNFPVQVGGGFDVAVGDGEMFERAV